MVRELFDADDKLYYVYDLTVNSASKTLIIHVIIQSEDDIYVKVNVLEGQCANVNSCF